MSVKRAYVDRLRPIAAKVEREGGTAPGGYAVPAGIRADPGVIQSAHESAWGGSGLSSPASRLEILNKDGLVRVGPANNLFGFTAELGTYWRSRNLPFVIMDTHEWVEPAKVLTTDVVVEQLNPKTGKVKVRRKRPFRAYDSWEASYLDWARLMHTDHYVKAGALDALRRGDLKGHAAAMARAGYATDPNYAASLERVGREISLA